MCVKVFQNCKQSSWMWGGERQIHIKNKYDASIFEFHLETVYTPAYTNNFKTQKKYFCYFIKTDNGISCCFVTSISLQTLFVLFQTYYFSCSSPVPFFYWRHSSQNDVRLNVLGSYCSNITTLLLHLPTLMFAFHSSMEITHRNCSRPLSKYSLLLISHTRALLWQRILDFKDNLPTTETYIYWW